jgi:hypothetical protein
MVVGNKEDNSFAAYGICIQNTGRIPVIVKNKNKVFLLQQKPTVFQKI